ncbi:hypothetical protein Q0812_13485 [Brevundimonas sp. 2R-24]|uniref:Erythromycin esterase n=1 Tax=Peiella sedimenti TaxID=3061083 RepID=A0ABT8SPC9_9CAUL|nr:hypothetical protein [Caulobacteraceae bacterium XZ-24]
MSKGGIVLAEPPGDTVMHLDRRSLFAGLAGGSLALTAGGSQAQEPAPAPPAPQPAAPPAVLGRLTAAAEANRLRLDHNDGAFSGPAWDALLSEARAAKHFLLGEEHGIAENARLAGQLFEALGGDGYDHAVIETSPPMADALDEAAKGGLDGLRAFFAQPGSFAAFFTMREEAEWLATARASRPGVRQVLWGLDYEMGADRRLIGQLEEMPKPPAAQTALETLKRASAESWAQFEQTRNPQFIYGFSGDPALVQAVQASWPDAPEAAQVILTTLERTFVINRDFGAGQNWRSNQTRNDLNRANLRRYWRAAQAEGRRPKLFFKFGASHMVRGVSHTETFDLGTMVAEMADMDEGRAFHLLVLPGQGARTAVFNPSAFTYEPSEPRGDYAGPLGPLVRAAWPDAMTLIDLRPLRPLLSAAQARRVERDLARTVHGFDAVLVMSGSTPSQNLV